MWCGVLWCAVVCCAVLWCAVLCAVVCGAVRCCVMVCDGAVVRWCSGLMCSCAVCCGAVCSGDVCGTSGEPSYWYGQFCASIWNVFFLRIYVQGQYCERTALARRRSLHQLAAEGSRPVCCWTLIWGKASLCRRYKCSKLAVFCCMYRLSRNRVSLSSVASLSSIASLYSLASLPSLYSCF